MRILLKVIPYKKVGDVLFGDFVYKVLKNIRQKMKRYKISNLDCPSCASHLEEELKKDSNIIKVRVDFSLGALYLECKDFQKAVQKIKEIESEVIVSEWEERESEGAYEVWREVAFLSLLLGVFGACIFFKDFSHTLFIIVLLGIYLIAGLPVFKGAYGRIKEGEIFDENFLMLFATLSAWGIGAYEEAVAVMLFFRVGEFFEGLAVRKSRRSISSLLEVAPSFALKKVGEELIEVSPKELEVGDVVLVRVGEKIPSDGVIIKGESEINAQAISGESLPIFKARGDSVLGGCINLLNVLEVQITQPYEKSSIATLVELVQSATSKKAKVEKLITSFAKIYTPCVFVLSVLIALLPPLLGFGEWRDWIYKALVVMMVSCPCALVLSVPLGYFGGIGGACAKGILIKGANYLEALAKMQSIFFDKTGTLSEGRFEIIEVVPMGGISKEELLSLASCAEHLSNHPIAQSLNSSLPNKTHTSIYNQQISGMGMCVKCCGNEILAGNLALLESNGVKIPSLKEVEYSVVHIAKNGEYMGYIGIEDKIKAESLGVVKRLQEMGIEVGILSGDLPQNVKRVADRLGVKQYFGGLLPQDKLSIFEKNKKGVSAFVGDGINDAPVLASADVGISMGKGGSELSKESADVIIINDDLEKIVEAISHAKKTQNIIKQNIIFALGVKGVFIILGIFGVAGMWEAVFGDVGVALLALLNSTRALK